MYKYIFMLVVVVAFSGCTQIVTAPISAAGAIVGGAVDVVGSVGGAVVHTVTGGSKKK